MKHGLLISYHYVQKNPAQRLGVVRQCAPGVKVVLDSGAFSAAQSGSKIGLLDYAKHLRQYRGFYDWCASLDVIGDPVKTKKNWLFLRNTCPDIVPTVHALTDPDTIKWYADRGATRIALGGLVPHSRKMKNPDSEVRKWLDKAFEVIQTLQGVKIHGFGVSGPSIAREYDWTTCDSTTVTQSSVFLRPLVGDSGSIKTAKVEEVSADVAKYIFSGFEVVPGHTGQHNRRRRFTFGVLAMHNGLCDSGLDIFYHAVDPGNYQDIGGIYDGMKQVGSP